MAPHAGGHGHLRASDSDRAHVIDTLKAGYVDGLVTKDEFDARVSQTFASRTLDELALVTADLPAGLAASQRPQPAPTQGKALADANVRPGERAITAMAVFAGLALVISVSAGPFASPAAFLLLLGGAGGALVSLFLLRNRIRGSRRGAGALSTWPSATEESMRIGALRSRYVISAGLEQGAQSRRYRRL